MSPPPIPSRWDGESWTPLPTFAKAADEHYVIGEVYSMAPVEERSGASHRHYFAEIKNAWENLPDHLAQHHKTPDALRKFALIQTGHCDAMTTVCMFKTEALRLAALIRRLDEYAMVVVDGKIVTRYTAKSQSLQAMGKAAFQQSKDDVLGFVASLIGVAPADLARAA